MISNEVIERLKKKNWFVTSQNKQEASLVLQACDDAGITWADGEKATEWFPFKTYPLDIGFFKEENGITQDYYNLYEKHELENITDWFFDAIKNNDSKLIPQNAEQEHYVQILLAKMQRIPVECYFGSGDGWVDSTILYIDLGRKYRIKPTTPLPISREIWESVDKKWQYAAMNKDKEIYFFEHSPRLEVDGWVCYQLIDGFHRRVFSFLHSNGGYTSDPVWDSYKSLTSCTICSFNINTDNIDWEYSLTCRPEGI